VAWVFIDVGFLSTNLHGVPCTQVVKTCYKLQIITNKQCERWNVHSYKKTSCDHELVQCVLTNLSIWVSLVLSYLVKSTPCLPLYLHSPPCLLKPLDR
jgi:hypothetical protein